jgi:hypothetical protein
MVFGSHLYGTNTEDSDTDYKGIFLPSAEDILLQQVPKSINTSTGNDKSKNSVNDIDEEMYSLNHFIHLACQGETVALDMLHAPDEMVVSSSPLWDYLVTHRHLFYTKNLKSFVGYCRKQAAKYGIKGSRLADAQKVIDYLRSTSVSHMKWIWDRLPEGEHIHFHNDCSPRMYEVCGKKIQETVQIDYATDILENFITQYGHRAELAAKNEGIDWKAISHALRAAIQVQEILESGTITFPLPERRILREIKEGKLDYLSVVAPMLEEWMDRVEQLSEESNYPEQVDRKVWDRWLCTVLSNQIVWDCYNESI